VVWLARAGRIAPGSAAPGVSLDTATFEDLGDGRTRVTILGTVENLAARDMILAGGMDHGITEGYEQLDAVLRTLG
jgi:uncharacterized protein YndB with AHSA1/START domain